ncbi:MAG: endonuclease/exonuclease/phosphatase family protein [Anaerolineae bacterium]
MKERAALRFIEATAVFLFALQAIRVLFSVLFGIIYDVVVTGPMTPVVAVIFLLLLLAFLSPLFAPRRTSRLRWALFIPSLLVSLSRAPLTLNDPQARLYSSLLIIAAFGFYAATLLRQSPLTFPQALIAALAVDQFLRALGNTFDITLRDGWLPYQTILSVALAGLSWRLFSLARGRVEEASVHRPGLLGGLAIGAFLFLELSLLSFPNAVARWSGGRYAALAPALLLVTLLPLLPGVQRWRRRWQEMQSTTPWLWGMILVLLICTSLAVGYLFNGIVASVALLLSQLLVLLALPGALTEDRDRSGLGLAVGNLFFLLLNFAYAFAFAYAYTLPFFRGTGLPIVLVGALVATLPTAIKRLPPPTQEIPSRGVQWAVAALLVIVCAVLAWPPTPQMKEAGPNVRVGTYNIHYGYRTDWRFYLEEMARTIEESGADIVALQEVDAGRITSYGVDDALWLARRLRMGVVYQPTVEHLTGIALLYRFPLQRAEGQLLTSHLEQTAIVHAQVSVGGEPLDAYGIWLGLEPEERAAQLTDALEFIAGEGPVVLGGDFNSTPDSPVYRRLVEAGFDDPFVAGGFEPAPTFPSESPQRRIDYVWMRGLSAVNAQVLDSTASDHRMVVIEARFE